MLRATLPRSPDALIGIVVFVLLAVFAIIFVARADRGPRR